MGAFATVVQTMLDMNVFHLFFPWLLIMAVTFGVLEKYSIFEDDAVNGVIALTTAFLAIGGIFLFVPEGLFTNFAAALAFGVFGILGLVILLAIAGVDVTEFDNPASELPGIGALVIAIIAFIGVVVTQIDVSSILGTTSSAGGSAFNDVVMPILVLVFLLLVVGSVSSE